MQNNVHLLMLYYNQLQTKQEGTMGIIFLDRKHARTGPLIR
jgi:hypothetical protein